MNNLQELNIIKILSSFVGFSEDDILNTIKLYSKRYKLYKIPKASGGYRTIHHPARPLKVLQYALISMVFSKIPINSISIAYVKGNKSPLKILCDCHSSYKYTIRLDFKDFFPSITPQDIFRILENHYILTSYDKHALTSLLFFRLLYRYILPIGSPASPIISNIVMFEFDKELSNIANSLDKESVVSRYADDVYFSTNKKNICHEFHKKIDTLCRQTESPKLTLNESKTLYMSTGTKRVVCGLIATSDFLTSIGRKRKNFVKKQLYLFNSGSLSEDEIYSLKGYLAFIRDCEPSFYNRLIIKYGSKILE